ATSADAWPISASAGRSSSLQPKCEAHMDKVLAGPVTKQHLVSRRGFLIGAAGTSVLFGFPRPGLTAADAASTSPAALFEPTIWYRLDRSGIVTVSIIRAEMGQHVGTALARIVADELEADWDKVRLGYVDTGPKWGLMLTGASWSVWQTFMPFSQAGAAGRIALIEEGAKLLNVDRIGIRDGMPGVMMPGFAHALGDADIARLAAYLRRTRTELPAWTNIESKVAAIRKEREASQ